MSPTIFVTKEQLIQELGISKATFYRRAKKLNIILSRGLLSPQEQLDIKMKIGVLPQLSNLARSTESDDKQILRKS